MKNRASILFGIVVIIVIVGVIGLIAKNIFVSKKIVDKKSLPIIKIAAAAPAVPHFISQIIKMNQFDKEFGFQLEIVGVDPTQTVTAIVNDTVNIAVIGIVPVVNINTENINIEMFAPALKLTCPFMVSTSSGISNLDQLKGKKMGITVKSGATYPLLATIFKKLDIDIEKNFNMVEGQFFALPTMLLQGDVDVIAGICDEISNGKFLAQGKMQQIGSIENLSKEAYGDKSALILSGFASKKEWLDSHPELAKSFLQAFHKSVDYISKNPQVYNDKEIIKIYNLTPDEIKYAQNFIKTYNNYSFEDWDNSINSINLLIQDAHTYGYIKSLPNKKIFINLK